jgi:hypothetical protein
VVLTPPRVLRMLAIIQKAAPFRLLDGTRFHVGAEPLNCIDDHRTGPSRGLDELLPDAIESDLCNSGPSQPARDGQRDATEESGLSTSKTSARRPARQSWSRTGLPSASGSSKSGTGPLRRRGRSSAAGISKGC